ncbi:CU044_2847 family protein [Streptomyces sp. WAC06614]|uniref:CU044_2847 family protein n=1 Tax=Streptomyces sp. WAC06614 TaxID=2487416 RepID=UPI000F7BB16C|nr:CU044_2847 family protein [Streptomyces sp. WAC06614]RSS62107.1 hypothetical protein EF918_31485 [Streptomyces sp. WAC06614]
MERQVQEIELPGGETVLARVSVLRPDEVPDTEGDFGYEDVSALEQLTARVDRLGELVSGLGAAVLRAAEAAAPDEISATFGIELVARPGRAVAMLADGEATAAISVTLTWRPRDRPAPGAAAGDGR